ncbi:MAG TPA: hypothetical protein VKA01_18475 [Vicinamibacteria bacterium]|nr:hypothetical protein [Vicinamibacteria bacterium]
MGRDVVAAVVSDSGQRAYSAQDLVEEGVPGLVLAVFGRPRA